MRHLLLIFLPLLLLPLAWHFMSGPVRAKTRSWAVRLLTYLTVAIGATYLLLVLFHSFGSVKFL